LRAFTYRYLLDASPNTTSQEALVNNAISSQLQTIRSQIRYIFGSLSEFGPFSNDIWIPANTGTYPSLEDIRDKVPCVVDRVRVTDRRRLVI